MGMNAAGIRSSAAALAEQAGLGALVEITPLAAGGNNRVYRLDCATGPALLKQYFQGPAGHDRSGRDRLGSEYGFAEYAAARDLPAPRPLACDCEAGLGLYEFIDGRKLEPGEPGWEHLAQALEFLVGLNADQKGAEALPDGAEACFEPEAHLKVVDRRITRLMSVVLDTGDMDTGVAADAAKFLHGSLVPAWEQVREDAAEATAHMGLLPPEFRMVSPSDFGFHNALLTDEGGLYFFDFEYAGLDDPAKCVCDFFCQPAVPAPRMDLARFIGELAEEAWTDELFPARVDALFPVYQIKWVTILLNEFLPGGLRRREFATVVPDPEERRRVQLTKARQALAAVC